MFLQEYIKLRTEQVRELTHLELDRNLQYVANPWNPNRSYKEGMIVYFGDTSTGSTGLGWWRANKDHGPSNIFDVADWDAIGASPISGNILVRDSNNITQTINLLEFSPEFNVIFSGTNALVEISPAGLGGFWSQTGSTIYYEDNVLIGTDTIIDPNMALTVVGSQLVTGDLIVSGDINGVNLANFFNDYNSHTHTILPTSFTNYSTIFPNSNGQLADIEITTLTNGDFLQWDSSINRWRNVQSVIGPHNLGFHSDVNVSVSNTPSNNQIFIYNGSANLWENRTLVTNNDTGFTGAPFSHNHDIRYWTKSQLSSNTGAIINWNNIFNVPSFPSGSSTYVLMSPDVNLPDARTLTAGTGININDLGPGNNVELSIINESSVQLINVESNGSYVGTKPTLNFIDSPFITSTVVDNSVDNRIDVLIEFNGISLPENLSDLNDIDTSGAVNGNILAYNGSTNIWEPTTLPTSPVISVNGQTGTVVLDVADLNDTSIIPGNFPGSGTGTPFTPDTNILVYDDDISKWINIPASQLLAGISGIFLNDILDVNVVTGLGNGDILYYDGASELWLSGSANDANIYTISDLQGGVLNNLYYTQIELNTPASGAEVHWNNITNAPNFAPSTHTHFLWELIDVFNYNTGPSPSNGDILVWNDTLSLWEAQPNISTAFSIISNSSTIGSYVQTQDITLNPDILNSLEIQSDNGIILETDTSNNIIKIGTSIDGTSLIYNTDGSISVSPLFVGVTVDGKFISGAQQTIDVPEVLDIPINFEYNLFTLNLDGTAIIDGDLNIIDDSCCSTPTPPPTPTPVQFGRFGISDADGEFTYYSSLFDAMNAAVAGDTIQAFADFKETVNEVVLKDGVDINFNGYTYTFDSPLNSNALSATASVQCSIYNGMIERTGGSNSLTDSLVLSVLGLSARIKMIGVELINSTGSVIYCDDTLALTGSIIIRSLGVAINGSTFSLSGITITSDDDSIAIDCDQLNLYDVIIQSNNGFGINCNDLVAFNSQINSLLGLLVENSIQIKNCQLISFGGNCVVGNNSSNVIIESSTMVSVGGSAIVLLSASGGNAILNNTISSSGSSGIIIGNITSGLTRVENNTISTVNGTGISISLSGGTSAIITNTILVTRTDTNVSLGIRVERTSAGEIGVLMNSVNVVVPNINAHALEAATGSLSINYMQNQLRSTTASAVGPNIIQGQVNTIDNFGNIEIG